jgi:phosphoribosylamine---glycine ligase
MKILVVGGGGREHALAWKLAQEAEVVATPGNPGIAEVARLVPGDPVDVAQAERVDLVVVGPEDPLVDGLADRLRAVGVPCFGPGAAGAQLEGSKALSKELMHAAGVPTAMYGTFQSVMEAKMFARARFDAGRQVAVKASGNALGKGVIVCAELAEAEDALERMMVAREFGPAGETVVVEDRLVGREFSLLTLVSDAGYRSLPVAQDYKRALDGDLGSNTGGMGTYSPVPHVPDALLEETERRVVAPILAELSRRGIEYRGVLFSGLMMHGDELNSLEYNVRFGDPETQTVVRRLGSGFATALFACAVGEEIPPFEVLDHAAVTVVLASGGYPGSYEKGLPITVESLPEDVVLFHAGTALREGGLVTNGGRVFGVSAVGPTVDVARSRAYAAAEHVRFPGKHLRSDIGA